MRIPRIYHSQPLVVGTVIALEADAANHVGRVLRLQEGHNIELFCGDNHSYSACISAASKKHVEVRVESKVAASVESPLQVHLVQGISRGDRMDFTLQKAVELGVSSITPVFTERCGVKLQGERLEKKQLQWQKIVIAACEQSGRNLVPTVHTAVTLDTYLDHADRPQTLTLEPSAEYSLKSAPVAQELALLIGPEGGFSAAEIERTRQAGCIAVRLGPRVLRTETAALTALAALQANHGDLV
ncbi:16S rRNA (uracil(1498)-N(3))-methyltransferase [Aliidiomarina maris]|uniref:Ribosomal RNA small subunit methyltransferase E n=1 Tax=Aliidiomarina maris TaxID=531312 RepID=A0A327WRX6_9GAMM|nr:16S rRNA (uracil(1498)-N(3))-methyltransferase [Aliidiomarina maris]RAJ94936.1 16S rRNA m(3)U-1498 methyltransferase [Aliidiomarina maris]RUO22147.1 16S rRNA (uracil(1498)-N(3))-methyltransferase [Aliidiomarina maris]